MNSRPFRYDQYYVFLFRLLNYSSGLGLTLKGLELSPNTYTVTFFLVDRKLRLNSTFVLILHKINR